METIYLDNNATTPLLEEVADAMRAAHAQHYGNPASQHSEGRRARAALEDARDGIAQLLGAETGSVRGDRVIFTSGGTEANNLALRGIASGQPGRIVISAIEHASIAGTADYLARSGWQIDRLPVDASGVVRVEALEALLTRQTRLVSVMLGNNETGALQPIGELADECSQSGALVHTDAVQAIGKHGVNFRQLGVHALTAAAHKFHGPHGIGVLIVKHAVPLDPLMFGGFQQGGLRPGTESVVLAIGMHKALELWHTQRDQRVGHLLSLRDRLERGLLEGAQHEGLPVVINAQTAPRLPQTTSVSFPGLDRQALVMALDMAGVACSSGSACASGSSEPSATLLAMGLPEAIIRGSIRLSVGLYNTPAEIDEASTRILRACKDLWRQESARKIGQISPATPAKTL